MNATAGRSAIHAVSAFFGIAGAHAVADSIPALTAQQAASVFLLAFGRELLSYLDTHPLPELPPLECQDRVRMAAAIDRIAPALPDEPQPKAPTT